MDDAALLLCLAFSFIFILIHIYYSGSMASLSIEEGGSSSLSSLGASSSSSSLDTATPTVTVLPDKVPTGTFSFQTPVLSIRKDFPNQSKFHGGSRMYLEGMGGNNFKIAFKRRSGSESKYF
jgi:hypothetical protein